MINLFKAFASEMYCRLSTCGGGDEIGIVVKPIVSPGLINTFVVG